MTRRAERAGRGRVTVGVAGILVMAIVAGACSSDGDSGATWSVDSDTVTVASPASCVEVGCVGDGVDTFAGTYRTRAEDVVFPPGLYGIELTRAYTSSNDGIGWFGRGWSTVYETTLIKHDDGLTVNAPAGLRPLWNPDAPAAWDVAGSASVEHVDGGYSLLWPTGERWSFDDSGSLDSMVSPYGAMVTIERTGDAITVSSSQDLILQLELDNGKVVAAASSDGRRAEYEYVDDLLVGATAPGADARYRYDADQLLTDNEGPTGTTTNTFADGRLTGQRTTSGQRLAVEYGIEGTLIESTGPPISYEHDTDGRLIRVGYGDHYTLLRSFDTDGRLVSETEYAFPDGMIVTAVENSYTDGRLTSSTVNGATTTYRYDGQGRVTDVQGPTSVSFEYAGDDPLPAAVTTPASGRTSLDYDGDFVVAVTDATDMTTLTTRDSLGNPTGTGISPDTMWTYEFDAEGNATTTTSPTGRTWITTWGPKSTLLGERDPRGRTTSYDYDTAGRLVRELRPGRGSIERVYDDTGQLISVTEPDDLTTRYEYDTAGRVATVVLPGDRTWRMSYDDRSDGSQIVTATAPDGTATVTTLDSSGREIERRSVESDGQTVETTINRYQYNRLTETAVRRGPSNLATATTYDDAGHIVGVETTIDGKVTRKDSYDYDAGRLVVARSGNDSATYDYDDAGRLLEITTPDDTWAATYRDGQIVTAKHNDDITDIERDLDDRPVQFVDDHGVATVWRYDDADRPVSRTVADATASFEWNDADQLTSYRAPTGSTWTWAYNDAAKLTGAVEPGGATTTYEYDLGAISHIRTAGGGHDRDDTYTYDARGLVRTADTSVGKFQYGYDAAGRTNAVDGPRDNDDEAWQLNAAGQVVQVTSGDRAYTLSYTPAGQLDEIVGPDDEFVRTSWAADQLTGVEVDDHDPLGITADQQGRLVSVTWDDDTHIDLNWNSDNSFDIRQRDSDEEYAYELTDGTLNRFEHDGTSYTATQRPDGYLDTLSLLSDDVDGTVQFDAVGRPATLRSAGLTSTITYDPVGRVSSVLTTKPDDDPEQTIVTYDDGRHIDGEDDIVDAMFDDAGALKQSLPNTLRNPISAAADTTTLQTALAVDGAEALLTTEPDPFAQIDDTLAGSTPELTSPIGVRDRLRLARQLVVAEASRLAPTVSINQGLSVRVPIIDPEDGNVADYNPFVDATPSGLALGVLAQQAGGGSSLLDRAVDQLADVVGGVISFSADAARFVISNPIAQLVLNAASIAAPIACAFLGPACITPAAVVIRIAAVVNFIDATRAIAANCPTGGIARCGLSIAYASASVAEFIFANRIAGVFVRGVSNRFGVSLVNGREPINATYAGRIYNGASWTTELATRYPDGVRFSRTGFPDFSPYARAQVRLEGLTGSYGVDAAAANRAVGLARTPLGQVWHHVEDGQTMILIPQEVHNAVRHTGGAAIIRGG